MSMRVPLIGRWLAVTALALAAVLLPPSGSSITLAAAPAALEQPTASFEAWFEVEQPPSSPFEAVQMVVDFPSGARVGRHIHGGPGYITMLDGEMTMTIGDAPMRAYTANESFVEPFKVVAEGANLSAASSSLLVTYLLPVGAPVTTLVTGDASAPAAPLPPGQLPPGAVPRFETRMRLESAPDGYRLGQMLRTYQPGSWTLSELRSEPRLLTVVSGEVRVLTGASEKTYTAGEFWSEMPGAAWLSGNLGERPAVVAVSVVAPKR
jgi:quercetin dioxygenase-like cupin family protein